MGAPSKAVSHLLARVGLFALALAGCDGEIMDPSDPVAAGVEVPAPQVRATRLTHAQYRNTLRDLLGVSDATLDPVLSTLRDDPRAEGFLFDNLATSLEVDDALFGAYQRAAEELASAVLADAAALGRVRPAGTSADDFIRDFGLRVHRRPLSGDEVAEYRALHEMGPLVFPDDPAEEASTRLVLEAMLQSPAFLYRFEESTDRDGVLVPLDDWEIASRLSYALWGSMPDDELLEAARTGGLGSESGVRAAAERMLDDPRALSAVRAFHGAFFDFTRYAAIRPSDVFFPDAPADLGGLARTESELFVGDAFASGLGYGDMMVSTRTFANAETAAIYGLDPAGMTAEFVPVELDPSQRRGFLTHIGFLASHSTSVNPDPIHRGVYVGKVIQCMQISAPPDDTPLPPPGPSQTNRETVEAYTEMPMSDCATCHATIINPLGFPFESFDAIGAWRTMDAGEPIDTTSQALVNGRRIPIDGARQLAGALSSAPNVHACYSRRWIEFMHGRATGVEDRQLIARLGDGSQRGELAMRDVILQIVTSRGFRNRAVEELP